MGQKAGAGTAALDRPKQSDAVRACDAQLGVEMIPAYSPEARGRCERMFATHQERIAKELAARLPPSPPPRRRPRPAAKRVEPVPGDGSASELRLKSANPDYAHYTCLAEDVYIVGKVLWTVRRV